MKIFAIVAASALAVGLLIFLAVSLHRIRKGKNFVWKILNTYMYGIDGKTPVQTIEQWVSKAEGFSPEDDLQKEIKQRYAVWNAETRHTSRLTNPKRSEHVLSMYAVVYRMHLQHGLFFDQKRASEDLIQRNIVLISVVVDSVIEQFPSYF